MKISFPSSGPTDFLTLPDPEFRDQGQFNIGTTFKRMIDGTVVPFHHLPATEEISLVFNTLKYKKAREFIDFMIKGNNQEMVFESDTGVSGEFLDRGTVKGTIISDPIGLITQDDTFKNIAIVVALQKTIPLQPKHRGDTLGNQSLTGDCTTFYLIGGNDGISLLGQTDAYSKFEGLDGFWSEQTEILTPDRESSASFSIRDLIYVTTGYDGSTVMGQTNVFEPAFNAKGVWSSIQGSTVISRQFAIGFELFNNGYLVGGENNASQLISCVERFDPDQESWSIIDEQICLGIKNAYAFSFSDKAYVGGGNIGSVTGVIRSFDGSVWVSVLTSPLIERESAKSGGEGVSLGVIFGGEDSGGVITSSSSEFDATTSVASASTGALPTVVTNHASASLSGTVFSVSGKTLVSALIDENNEYDFSTKVWVGRTVTPTPSRNNAVAPCSNAGGIPLPKDFLPPIVEVPVATGVIVTGGFEFAQTAPSKKVFKWDFGSLTANVLWDMPNDRVNHQQASIDSSVYVIDGEETLNFPTPLEAFWEFTINDIWVDRSLKGEFFDSQPRDTSVRSIRSQGRCDAFNSELYLAQGLTGYPATVRENFPAVIDRWNAGEGWKARLTELDTVWDFRYGVSSGVLSQEATSLDQDGLNPVTVSTGAIFYLGGIKLPFSTSLPITFVGDVRSYFTQLNSFQTRTKFREPTADSQITNLSGELYLFGFSADLFPVPNIDSRNNKYNPVLDSWSIFLASAGSPIDTVDYANSNTSKSDTGVFFGGRKNVPSPTSDKIELYDATLNTWSTDTGVLPAKFKRMKASPINNTLTPTATKVMLVHQGSNAFGVRAKTFIYNPVDNSTTSRPSHGSRTSYPVMESDGGFSYVIGKIVGVTKIDNTLNPPKIPNDSSTHAFDETASAWVTMELPNLDLGVAREGAISGVYNGDIIMLGGWRVAEPAPLPVLDQGASSSPAITDPSIGGNTLNRGFHKYEVAIAPQGVYVQGDFDQPEYLGYQANIGTMVGAEIFFFAGVKPITTFNFRPSRNSFLSTRFITTRNHNSWDLSVWLAPVKTIHNRSNLTYNGLYVNVAPTTNILIGGESTQEYSRTQFAQEYDTVGKSFTKRGEHQAFQDITGQFFDGAIFFVAGAQGATKFDQFNRVTDFKFIKASTKLKYTVSNGSISALGATIVDGKFSDGLGRASSSF